MLFIPRAIQNHFTGKPHFLTSDIRTRIVEFASQYSHLIQNASEAKNYQFPSEFLYYFVDLELFFDDFHCEECLFTTRTFRSIQDHFYSQHGWENPRKRGKPSKNQTFENPWISNITCQRFFRSSPGHQHFKVNSEISFEAFQQSLATRSRRTRSSRPHSTNLTNSNNSNSNVPTSIG